MHVVFSVPGEPQGKGRSRIGRTAGGHARMFTPGKTVAYEGLIALEAMVAMKDKPLIQGPCSVEVIAVCSVPQSWPRKKQAAALAGTVRPAKKPDGDNILKAVCDGLNKVVWNDDVQAVDSRVVKIYGEKPELRVSVTTIGEGVA